MTKATWTIPIQVDTQVKSAPGTGFGRGGGELTIDRGGGELTIDLVIRGHPGRPAPDQGPDQGSWLCSGRA